MFQCKMIELLFKAFPLRIWQDFLLRSHLQKCPLCQKKLASVAEVRPFLIEESEVESTAGSWSAIESRLTEKPEGGRGIFPHPRRLAWMAGIGGLIIAVILGGWIYTLFTTDGGLIKENGENRFQINYIRVENQPANAYLYWPQGKDMVIIWAEKNM